MDKKTTFDINAFEREINNAISRIIINFQPLFKGKEIEIKYNGISRFGKVENGNYTSEVEVLFMTMNKIDYYLYLHIPVKKGLIKKLNLENITFINSNINLDNYIDKLKYINFINNKIQKKFFEKYYNTKELINKGVLNEKDLLSHLSIELNK